jgi:hypothetical protein
MHLSLLGGLMMLHFFCIDAIPMYITTFLTGQTPSLDSFLDNRGGVERTVLQKQTFHPFWARAYMNFEMVFTRKLVQ